MKQIIIILLLCNIAPRIFGQIYIQPVLEYAINTHPTIDNESYIIIDNIKTVYRPEFKFGEGIHIGLNIGYMVKDNFVFQLNSNQTIYSQFQISNSIPNLQLFNSYSFFGYFGDINYKSSIFQISPLIGYQIKKNKFHVTFKFGPNFMKSSINKELKYIYWDTDSIKNIVKNTEYNGKIHMGLQSNIGISYNLRDNLLLLIDFVNVSNNYELTNGKVIKYEIDGVNSLDKIQSINFDLLKKNNTFDYSYFGINIGITYILIN